MAATVPVTTPVAGFTVGVPTIAGAVGVSATAVIGTLQLGDGSVLTNKIGTDASSAFYSTYQPGGFNMPWPGSGAGGIIRSCGVWIPMYDAGSKIFIAQSWCDWSGNQYGYARLIRYNPAGTWAILYQGPAGGYLGQPTQAILDVPGVTGTVQYYWEVWFPGQTGNDIQSGILPYLGSAVIYAIIFKR